MKKNPICYIMMAFQVIVQVLTGAGLGILTSFLDDAFGKEKSFICLIPGIPDLDGSTPIERSESVNGVEPNMLYNDGLPSDCIRGWHGSTLLDQSFSKDKSYICLIPGVTDLDRSTPKI